MSDFDAALERLLTDPAFAARLAADPDRALSAYRLDPAEGELLRGQVVADTAAASAAVETRTTRSSTYGLFSSLGEWAEFGAGEGGGAPSVRTGLGDRPAVSGMGAAPRTGWGEAGHHGVAGEREIAPPAGYHNRVDADGDGDHDRATYRGRADGGVDILVDLDRDGRADFIGHDLDRDNRVDSAEYDENHDGVFEKKMYDDNGDGWLDRTVRQPDRP